MPTYTKVVSEGPEDPEADIRRQLLVAAKTWTAQGERISTEKIEEFRYTTTRRAGFDISEFEGAIEIYEERLGKAVIWFRISTTCQSGEPQKGCVINLQYKTVIRDAKHPDFHALAQPYCILGMFRLWKGPIECFAWTMGDYIEAIVDPDAANNLQNLQHPV